MSQGSHRSCKQQLLVGCRNTLMVMVNSTNGNVLAQVPIGPGVDASAYDHGTKFAFSSSGGDATVTICARRFTHDTENDSDSDDETGREDNGSRSGNP